jgi:hypothetical protein
VPFSGPAAIPFLVFKHTAKAMATQAASVSLNMLTRRYPRAKWIFQNNIVSSMEKHIAQCQFKAITLGNNIDFLEDSLHYQPCNAQTKIRI